MTTLQLPQIYNAFLAINTKFIFDEALSTMIETELDSNISLASFTHQNKINEYDYSAINELYTTYKAHPTDGDRTPSLVPFGTDDYSNLFCFHEITHEIYFWDHEINDGNVNNIGTKICNTFVEFLEVLLSHNNDNIDELKIAYTSLKDKGY